jgi:hypothetical protein
MYTASETNERENSNIKMTNDEKAQTPETVIDNTAASVV